MKTRKNNDWFVCVLSVYLSQGLQVDNYTTDASQDQSELIHRQHTHGHVSCDCTIKEIPQSSRVTSVGSLSGGLYSCTSFCFHNTHRQSTLCMDVPSQSLKRSLQVVIDPWMSMMAH